MPTAQTLETSALDVDTKKLAAAIAEGLRNGSSHAASVFVNDPRIDKLIKWSLTAAAGVALALGAWYARSLDERFKSLGDDVAVVMTDIAVLRETVTNLAQIRSYFEEQQALDRQERAQLRQRLHDLERLVWTSPKPKEPTP